MSERDMATLERWYRYLRWEYERVLEHRPEIRWDEFLEMRFIPSEDNPYRRDPDTVAEVAADPGTETSSL